MCCISALKTHGTFREYYSLVVSHDIMNLTLKYVATWVQAFLT